MKREKMDGIIMLPSNPAETVWMRDFEIAELFGVMLPTVKSNIRVILKSNVVTEDTTNGATLVGRNILPDYFGLDMITAIAFRINSMNARLFRDFVIQKNDIDNNSKCYTLIYFCRQRFCTKTI